ncbi:hypothetical protein N9991_00210 [bacterium]|jgi:hypothetical protein|nr:hypothetical protein [bacterium]
MITRRYFYDETGQIVSKSIGDGLHFSSNYPYIETEEDYNLTQYRIVDGEFVHTPVELPNIKR